MVRYNSFAVFLFAALALVIASGFSLGAALLTLGAAVLLKKRADLRLERDDYLMIGALSLYFVVNAANNYLNQAPLREYDAPLRFLFVIPALLSLLAYPPRDAALWSGLAAGGIGAGLLAGWQFLFNAQERAYGSTNPIQYGNISLLLGIFCLCGLSWALTQRRKLRWLALLAAGAVSGMLGSLLSGSRGSWIALPFCIGVLALNQAGAHGKRHMQTGLLALVALVAALYALPQSGIEARTTMAVHETEDYFVAGKAETSVGQRLEMWRTGIAMLPGHLWLGWGKQGYMARKLELIRDGAIAPVIGEHTHLHNEYLDALVKHGVSGLLALLALYLAPLTLFARQIRNGSRAVHPYAIAGVLLCVCYLVFGLTQAFLTHNNGVMIFAFSLAILWAALRGHQRAAA